MLYQVIVQVILAFAFGGGQAVEGGFSYNANPVALVWGLAHLLPGIAVSIRRLHDTDHRGWWMLIGIVPLVGWIWILVYYVQRGTQGSNRFGPDTQSQAATF